MSKTESNNSGTENSVYIHEDEVEAVTQSDDGDVRLMFTETQAADFIEKHRDKVGADYSIDEPDEDTQIVATVHANDYVAFSHINDRVHFKLDNEPLDDLLARMAGEGPSLLDLLGSDGDE